MNIVVCGVYRWRWLMAIIWIWKLDLLVGMKATIGMVAPIRIVSIYARHDHLPILTWAFSCFDSHFHSYHRCQMKNGSGSYSMIHPVSDVNTSSKYSSLRTTSALPASEAWTEELSLMADKDYYASSDVHLCQNVPRRFWNSSPLLFSLGIYMLDTNKSIAIVLAVFLTSQELLGK